MKSGTVCCFARFETYVWHEEVTVDEGTPRNQLIAILQAAYSGEWAAAKAYNGHWKSLKKPNEVHELKVIEQEKLHHRECVGKMLQALGANQIPSES